MMPHLFLREKMGQGNAQQAHRPAFPTELVKKGVEKRDYGFLGISETVGVTHAAGDQLEIALSDFERQRFSSESEFNETLLHLAPSRRSLSRLLELSRVENSCIHSSSLVFKEEKSL